MGIGLWDYKEDKERLWRRRGRGMKEMGFSRLEEFDEIWIERERRRRERKWGEKEGFLRVKLVWVSSFRGYENGGRSEEEGKRMKMKWGGRREEGGGWFIKGIRGNCKTCPYFLDNYKGHPQSPLLSLIRATNKAGSPLAQPEIPTQNSQLHVTPYT